MAVQILSGMGGYARDPKKGARETREEFMFGTEPIDAWRMWDVESIAESLNDDMHRFVRAMAVASRKAPENPWEYMLAPRLAAVARADSVWEPRDPQAAVCTNDRTHTAPHLDCECGYWALKDTAMVAEQLCTSYTGADAVGRVKLWGRYCEFEKGYRAECAYPSEVWLLKGDAPMAANLSDAYGIPFHVGAPAFVTEHREKVAAERAKQKAEGATPSNWTTILSTALFPTSSGPTFFWNEDTLIPTTGWPSGLAKPSEFWDALEQHAARATEGRAT